jgi:hypothetical protein
MIIQPGPQGRPVRLGRGTARSPIPHGPQRRLDDRPEPGLVSVTAHGLVESGEREVSAR